MAIIQPFCAYRPKEEYISKVAALPYDVMSTEEAQLLIKNNPYSFLHIDKPEVHLPDASVDQQCKLAGTLLKQFMNEGVFIQDTSKSLYIYGLSSGLGVQYGLVCLVSVEEYETNIIKKHEKTRFDKEEERIKHVMYCNAHTGPIYLTYNGFNTFTEWMLDYTAKNVPIYHFISEDYIKHEVYRISDPRIISEIIHTFKEVPSLYIADGHHRAAAAASVAHTHRLNQTSSCDTEHFLAILFPKEQLHILEYNRLIHLKKAIEEQVFFDYLQTIFEIKLCTETIFKPDKRHTFGMRYKQQWYQLILKANYIDEAVPLNALDVSLLQHYILEPFFNITDPRNDPNIEFIGGIRSIETLNQACQVDDDTIAFSLYPTSMDELLSIADNNQLMPPKSTWFEPKLRSGIFIHMLDSLS